MNRFIYLVTFLILNGLLSNPVAHATAEIDKELDGLEVQLRHIRPRPVAKKAAPKRVQRPVMIAKKTYTMPTPKMSSVPNQAPQKVSSVPKKPVQAEAVSANDDDMGSAQKSYSQMEFQVKSQRSKDQIFQRFTILGYGTISTFDGVESQSVIPEQNGNNFNPGFAGAILTDVNFGFGKFVFESGAQVLRTGAYTGYAAPTVNYFNTTAQNGNSIYDENVTLTYVGIPLNAKYLLSGQSASSFFAKVGMTPSFLTTIEYNNYGAFFLDKSRYGGFSTFDLIFQGALGYSLRLSNSFHIVAEAGAYQGIIPVAGNFAIYNLGFIGGLGISYLL